MSRAPMIVVSLRVGRDLWRDARAKADERGEVLSEEIRRFLHRYVRRTK